MKNLHTKERCCQGLILLAGLMVDVSNALVTSPRFVYPHSTFSL